MIPDLSSDERPVLCAVHVGVKGHLEVLSKEGKHTFTHCFTHSWWSHSFSAPAEQLQVTSVSRETLRVARSCSQKAKSCRGFHHSCSWDSFQDTSGQRESGGGGGGGGSEVEGEAVLLGGGSSGKKHLSSCFMICSGGVCFKVLPRDWKCVTKTQTHGAPRRRNWLICLRACARVHEPTRRNVHLGPLTNEENRESAQSTEEGAPSAVR